MKNVRTYATSANLGPGFDCLGICFEIYNEYAFEVADAYELSGFEEEFLIPSNNLIIQSYEKVFILKQQKLQYLKLKELVKNIPNARGLGSSASCIVAGVLMANDILGNLLSKDEVFQIASLIEGHPDNVAPLIYGGLTCSFKDDKYYTIKLDVSDNFIFTVCIPSFELKTSLARAVLPRNIEIKDAVFNVSHCIGMIKALQEGNLELLKISNKDCLHEPYRYPLIEGASEVVKFASANDAVAMISGAGSTILLISQTPLNFKYKDWDIKEVKILEKGAYIYEK